ncbi:MULTISPECIES: hypothetical protein [unclassified Paenibacillus]|uniref:hypothetical protein n=1 Tax=unclassified Paenibacillus TaxID=185978 RepID=UPI0024061DE0|nr:MULTISPECIES: hypothetical protein [unclassified Paenibacillus]MDF9841944.1 hypothetical protein [Paenibacillus sp. PastF-2]MDF9848375.1 hypothetical protein [Paenibacillus sp. PastM-2]MDF9855104.1 hypothetical protein [Paenibacillus sp. PastF-1]MDH6480373.1 hypothetical protein [Paenibacillus sp. PastH-2]MDH6507643.1 hypothetical protein [Paenibacillus sp. PastM-3]
MDNFVSTAVFILPGILMYFWIQAFGINPVVKHSVPELAAITALMWLPVSIATIFIYNLVGDIYGQKSIWTLTELKMQADNLKFLGWFLMISIPVSFAVSLFYTKILYPIQRLLVNSSRKKLGVAPLTTLQTVWEEFFIKVDEKRNKGVLAVRVYKLDKPGEESLVGVVDRASRPYETERALVLDKCADLKASDKHYVYEVIRTYVDIKSGIVIQEIDPNKPTQNKEDF